MDSPAALSAAKCMMPSNLSFANVRSIKTRSPTEPSTKLAPAGNAEALLRQKLSTIVTSWPSLSKTRTTVPPMYPAPPVTRILILSPKTSFRKAVSSSLQQKYQYMDRSMSVATPFLWQTRHRYQGFESSPTLPRTPVHNLQSTDSRAKLFTFWYRAEHAGIFGDVFPEPSIWISMIVEHYRDRTDGSPDFPSADRALSQQLISAASSHRGPPQRTFAICQSRLFPKSHSHRT